MMMMTIVRRKMNACCFNFHNFMKMRGGRGGMNAGNQLNRNTTANASGIRVVVGRGGARTVVPVQRAQGWIL